MRYANNGVFNSTGRYAFAVSGSNDIRLISFTIQSVGKDENPAQAEALYVKGDKIQTHRVSMLGSGDALQIQAGTRLFLSGSSVRGYGDNLLSYGAAFFKKCDLISTYGPHGWPRNPETNHGDVFVESTFSLEGEGTTGDGHCDLARSPSSGASFPYAEFVLINCKLQGIAAEGWGAAGPDYTNVHFWEYNSVDLSDGKPVDVSKRVNYSRQLTMEKDAETIAHYSDPSYVLAGWKPELAPVLLEQPPASLEIPSGGSAELSVDAAAEPEPTYQWQRDGMALSGATSPTLTVTESGQYSVVVSNPVGSVTSGMLVVRVGGSAAVAPSAQSAGAAAAGTGGLGTQTNQIRAGSMAGAGASSPAAWPMAGAVASSPAVAGRGDAADGGSTPAMMQHGGGCSVSKRDDREGLLFLGMCMAALWLRRRLW